MLSKNGESITYQGLQDFFAENDCILNTEELGCLVKLLDRHGDGDIKPDDMKKYLATLNIKK
jgi:Ca2+-binding EF-hand superfamily protein